MKKIFALACATSALAIVSTANAASGSLGISTGDQFSVTIKGTVPGYCTLSSPGTFNVSNGTYTPSGNKNGTFDIANLGNAGGLVQEWTATGSFQITANKFLQLVSDFHERWPEKYVKLFRQQYQLQRGGLRQSIQRHPRCGARSSKYGVLWL